MFKGTKGGGLRTPRTRAEEIGTDSRGFDGIEYDAQAGVPKEMVKGTYASAVDSSRITPGQNKPSADTIPTPFKVGSK